MIFELGAIDIQTRIEDDPDGLYSYEVQERLTQIEQSRSVLCHSESAPASTSMKSVWGHDFEYFHGLGLVIYSM